MYYSVAFIAFAMLCNHHQDVFPKPFIIPHGNSVPIKQSLPTLPLPQTLITFNLLSVTMNLPVLDVSYQWTHIIFVILCLLI